MLNLVVEYLAKTAIKEAPEKEEQELKDLEAQEFHEVAEHAKVTRLYVEKERH